MAEGEKITKYIRIKDAVLRYSLSRSTINRALKSGELPSIKKGGAVLLEVTEADRWITGGETEE